MRLAHVGGLGLPAVVRGRGLGRRVGAYYEREAVAMLAAQLAPRGLRHAVIPFSAPYRPPPVILARAGRFENAYYVDYSHLYARLAEAVLAEAGYPELAGFFADMVRRREELPRWLRGRYILSSQASVFARYAVLPGKPCRSGYARRWWAERAAEPPLTEDEAVEVLAEAPCSAYAIRVADVVKYVPHVLVGMSRHWGTGLWESVINASHDAIREMAESVVQRGGEVLAIVVDAVVATEKPGKLKLPYRVKAAGDALVVLPFTFRVGEEYALWGVYAEPPVRRYERLVNGRLVLGPPSYIGGVEALRCHRPARRTWRTVAALAGRLGVIVGENLCNVRDTKPGELRVVRGKRVEGLLGVWAADAQHLAP